MSTSPTARTLTECKRRGWRAYVTEKWIPQIKRRLDAFGFGDVLVIDGEPGSLLVQCTTTDHAANRVGKIAGECAEAATDWLAAGNRIQVWGWALRGARGKRKVWTLKTYHVLLASDGSLQSMTGDQ